jgi:peptide/nickel transport system substrate-binding protein/oligopeptide transport system substrate-binding protein
LLSLAATVANLRGEYDKAKQYLDEAERLTPSAPREREESLPIGGTLTVALPNQVAQIHPVNSLIVEEDEIKGNVFETLLEVDEQGHLVPGLCQEWKVLEQGKAFLFTLRPNILMHDGNPLNSELVRTCFEESIRVGSERLPVAFAGIRGISKFLDGSADHVEGIRILSPNQLIIELEEALPIYPALLTDSHSSIALKTKDGFIAGTGPFKLISFEPESVVLERNEHYWKTTVPLDAVHFRCGVSAAKLAPGLRSGDFDVVSSLLPQDLEQMLQDRQSRTGFVEAPRKNIYFVIFNNKSPIAQVPELRQALCGIIRIDDIVRRTLGRFAHPAVGLLPPGILGHDPGRRQRQPLLREKAIELIKSSSLSTPIRLKAAVHPIFQDRYSDVTEELLKNWYDIGVQVSIETPTIQSYLDASENAEGFDLLIGRYNADYDDPDNFTYFLFHSKVAFFGFYSSAELDKLMEEARVQSEPAAREKLYHKIENHFLETSYLLPLFHDIDYRVAGPKVRGMKLYSSPPFVKYVELGKAETAAPAVQRKSGGGMLYVPLVNQITTLDHSMVNTVQQGEVLPNIFETLTAQAEGARIIPWLASEFHAEQGGQRFRFRLRDDVRFHDGRRVTARDVRYSFEYVLQKPESTKGLLAAIRGANALINGEAKELEGFNILSSSEFTIDLDQPLSFFPALLTHPSAAVVPEGTTQFNSSWREGCIGTGPFRVVGFEPGRRLELEANPNYWRQGYPKSDGLVFMFGVSPQDLLAGFRSGRFSLAGDLFPSDVEALRHESEFASRYREIPRLSTHFILFNTHHGPLTDENLRHQIVHAVDVESLVRRNVGRRAIPAHGLIPPGLLGYEPKRRSKPSLPQDRTPANIELSVMIHSLYEGPYSALGHELLGILKEKGFNIRIHLSKAELANYNALNEKIDLGMMRWVADYPDADTFIDGLLHSERGIYFSYTSSPEMDRLCNRGRIETRPELRHEIYQEAEQLIARRAILLPLFHEQTYRFARPEVQDFEVSFSIQTVPYEKLWLRK